MAEKTSKVCEIRGEAACDFLGSGGCKECPLYKQNVRQFERRNINKIWEVTLTNLPDDVDKFHEAEECFFCKKEKKNKRAAYAIVEIAHPDPPHESGEMFGIGKKVRRPVGSMIQVPVAVCKDCKRRLDLLIRYGGDLLPILIFLLLIALGYQGGKFCERALSRKYQKEMHLRFFEIPETKELQELGWFTQDEEGKGKMFVKKNKPRTNFHFIPQKRREKPQDKEE